MKEFDLSQFDMSDFAEMMKAIRKVGLMNFMKGEMSEPEHGGAIPMADEEQEEEEFQRFTPSDEEGMSEDMEEMAMKPKKKEYTMFSVKSDSPKMEMAKEMGNKAMGRMMLKKMMGK